jgi:hypothetical protein
VLGEKAVVVTCPVIAAAAAAVAADTTFFGADMLPDSDLDNNGLPNFQGNDQLSFVT